jgi:glycosyltransferase involved in cell wall biosynthesis
VTSNPQRIALDVTPLLGPRTGIGELVAGLVEGLQRRNDVEIVPVALSWRGRGEAGARHLPIPARLVQKLWAHTTLFPISTWVKSVDVVHGTNYVVGPPGRKASSDRTAPVRIVTVHDMTTVKTPHLCHPATLVFPTLVRRAVESGAFVQTDSHSTAAEVQQWLGLPAERIRVVYPGLPAIAAGSATGLDPRVATMSFVLTVGTEDPRKGLTDLAAAFPQIRRHCPELLWVHAGGQGWGSDELSVAIAKLPPQDRAAVVRLGRVTNDQRAWLLRNAVAFVYPSIDEGFGFPPLEALSVGTPVVASQLPVLRETLSNLASLVDARDSEALAQGVIDAIHGEGEGDSLATKRAIYTKRFSWDAMAADQVQWYTDCVTGRGKQAGLT